MSTPTLRLALALALIFSALGVKYTLKALDNRSAFQRWRPQVLELEQGLDISARHNYPNPPVMAVLLEPLARLPALAGALTWFVLKAGMALLALYWIFKLVEVPEKPFPPRAKALAALLSLKPVADDLGHGNVNLFILFLVVAALTLYRRRRDLSAGVVLALAIACKVTPALFVPYLAWKRSWKALAGVALGLALFLYPGLLPSLRLGRDENTRQLLSWYRGMARPFLVDGQATAKHTNQSLPGLAARLLTHSPSFARYDERLGAYRPVQYDNLLSLSPALARAAVHACLAGFALLVVLCCRTPAPPPGPRAGWRLAAEFSLIALGMLLFSERTWKHHCVTLALPFAVLAYALAYAPSARWRGALAAALALAVLLLFLPSLGPSADDDSALATTFGKRAQVYGAYAAAELLLVGVLALLLRKFPAGVRPDPEGGGCGGQRPGHPAGLPPGDLPGEA
jgi:alpha-1,2-mannosyltransferase